MRTFEWSPDSRSRMAVVSPMTPHPTTTVGATFALFLDMLVLVSERRQQEKRRLMVTPL